MSDFHETKERTARKPHRCQESGCKRTEQILPGQRYTLFVGRFDGEFYSHRVCARCARAYERAHRLMQAKQRYYPYEGPPLGDLLGWLHEERGM